MTMRATVIAVLLVASLSACATNPKVATTDGEQVDIRQWGSIGRLTGADVPLSLCSKGAQVACATGLFGPQCFRAVAMCNSAMGL